MTQAEKENLHNQWLRLNKNGRGLIKDCHRPKIKKVKSFEEIFLSHLKHFYFLKSGKNQIISKTDFSLYIKTVKQTFLKPQDNMQKIKYHKILLGLKSFQDKKYLGLPYQIM